LYSKESILDLRVELEVVRRIEVGECVWVIFEEKKKMKSEQVW